MSKLHEIDLFARPVNRARAAWFRGRDNFSLSDKRRCLVLHGGESAEFAFNLEARDLRAGAHEVLFSGMLELFDSHAYTRRHINSLARIEVNGRKVHDGLIHWRSHEETASFWPVFDFRFDGSLLREGRNTLRFTNCTSRAALGEFYDPQLDELLGAETAGQKLSTLYISDLAVGFAAPPRRYPRLAGVPRAAIAGSPFLVEVSTGANELPVKVANRENAAVAPLGGELELGEWRHLFEITPQTAGCRCAVALECGHATLKVAVETVYAATGHDTLVTGPGAETTYWEQLLRAAEDFFALESGNCLRISIDDYLNDLHHVPTEKWLPLVRYLIRRRRHYAMQRIRVPHYSKIPHARLGDFANMGGNLFAGVSVVEPVLFFAHFPEGRQTDLARRVEAYRKYFKKRLEEVRLPGHKTVTFDASGGMAGHYYDLGLDVQVSEVGPACNVLEESISRGAAQACNREWGVAVAQHWYVGQGAQYAYDEARVSYAQLTMFHSYLAGARQILWEGGMFDNMPVYNFILSEESWRDYSRRYDHPLLARARAGFAALLQFHRAQQLAQPRVEFAVVRGINDAPIAYTEATSRLFDMSMARAWDLLRVFLPHVCLQGGLPSDRDVRRWYSATPYGQVDIVPAEAPQQALEKYRLLSLLGWNTMTPDFYQRLVGYVKGGGTLFVSTAHFTVDTEQKLEWNFFAGGNIAELCGVRVRDLGGRIESVRFTAGDFAARYPGETVLSHKNPLFMAHFDERYAAFERDVTYFGGELELAGAEIVAVSQRHEPVVLRHRLGKGCVYLLNSYAHPGRGNMQRVAEMVLRALVEKMPATVTIDDKDEVVSWFAYPGKPFSRYFFLNTNWASPRRLCRTSSVVEGIPLRLTLKPAAPVQVATDGAVAIVISDPATQVVSWRKKGGQTVVTLNGGRGAVRVEGKAAGKVKIVRNQAGV